ncbi:DUF3572 domain-containing protein [Sphingomonas sp. ID0503]|uniref:DUF3572 domain-containing protein n=1 Tax=Sphingomonas sp. ID0503 TaxID=3399691 RepID=UPI003AFA4207
MNEPDQERVTTALSALAWTISDDRRAERLLALTGLTPDDLRSRVTEPAVLAAVLEFLEAHEPDLIACAEAIGQKPADIVATARSLSA